MLFFMMMRFLTPSTAAAEAFELLLRLIKIGDEVKPQIMRAIYI